MKQFNNKIITFRAIELTHTSMTPTKMKSPIQSILDVKEKARSAEIRIQLSNSKGFLSPKADVSTDTIHVPDTCIPSLFLFETCDYDSLLHLYFIRQLLKCNEYDLCEKLISELNESKEKFKLASEKIIESIGNKLSLLLLREIGVCLFESGKQEHADYDEAADIIVSMVEASYRTIDTTEKAKESLEAMKESLSSLLLDNLDEDYQTEYAGISESMETVTEDVLQSFSNKDYWKSLLSPDFYAVDIAMSRCSESTGSHLTLVAEDWMSVLCFKNAIRFLQNISTQETGTYQPVTSGEDDSFDPLQLDMDVNFCMCLLSQQYELDWGCDTAEYLREISKIQMAILEIFASQEIYTDIFEILEEKSIKPYDREKEYSITENLHSFIESFQTCFSDLFTI